jgi:hypothetical protein
MPPGKPGSKDPKLLIINTMLMRLRCVNSARNLARAAIRPSSSFYQVENAAHLDKDAWVKGTVVSKFKETEGDNSLANPLAFMKFKHHRH